MNAVPNYYHEGMDPSDPFNEVEPTEEDQAAYRREQMEEDWRRRINRHLYADPGLDWKDYCEAYFTMYPENVLRGPGACYAEMYPE